MKSWTDDPRVSVLLDAIKLNPPRKVKIVGPLIDYTIGRNIRPEYTRWSSDDVEALEDIWEDAFKALDHIWDEKGADAYHEAIDVFYSQIEPQALVSQVLDAQPVERAA